MKKRLYIPKDEGRISGVCAAIANYFDVDPTIIRIIAIVLLLFTNHFFTVFCIYILLAIAIPEEDEVKKKNKHKKIQKLMIKKMILEKTPFRRLSLFLIYILKTNLELSSMR